MGLVKYRPLPEIVKAPAYAWMYDTPPWANEAPFTGDYTDVQCSENREDWVGM